MSKERIFKELISEMAKDGEISSSEYEILLEKGKDLGFDSKTIDILIKLELEESSDNNSHNNNDEEDSSDNENNEFVFKSAITRGGSIITPDIIIVSENAITYKKRNKYLINFDSITIPISKISSVEVHSSLFGTDIIIKSFGEGEITGKKFVKSDAKEIKRLIEERQNN